MRATEWHIRWHNELKQCIRCHNDLSAVFSWTFPPRHGDSLRKRDDLIKNNRTRPFPSVQQPQQLGIVTTYSKLIWPLIWFWLGRKSLIEPRISQRKVNLVSFNVKSGTDWAKTGDSWGIYMCYRVKASALIHIMEESILAGVFNKICIKTPDLSKVCVCDLAACLACWASDFGRSELGLQ